MDHRKHRELSDRTRAAMARRMSASELLGRDLDYVPEHYEGPFEDADAEVLELERLALALEGELPGDLDPVHCTTIAWHLMQLLDEVEIRGFQLDDNPGAESAKLTFGHDFAVVRGRFVIDPWAVDSLPGDLAARKYVHDLQDARDRKEIERLYGDRTLWQAMDFDSPRERQYGQYDEAELRAYAEMGKPGAVAELEARGLEWSGRRGSPPRPR